MNSVEILDVLQAIAATDIRAEKEALFERHMNDAHFLRVIRAACDPMVTYGITPPKNWKKYPGFNFFDNHSAETVWIVLEQLRKRELTGKAAATAVEALFAVLDAKSGELLWRILSKDLRCGAGANTINRAVPGTIPIFSVMLAHKYEEKRIIKFPVAVEPKLDGLRVIGIVKDGRAEFFSRTGKHFPALDHLGPMVVHMVNGMFESSRLRNDLVSEMFCRLYDGEKRNDLVIDCEAVTGSFNKTTGDVRRKSETADDVILNVFDVVPYGFMTGAGEVFGMWFEQRRQILERLIDHAAIAAPIKITPLHLADSVDSVMQLYESYRSLGYEGAMVKARDGLYSKSRSRAWLKIKAEETEDLRIVGAFEGTGKYEGMLGGLIVDRAGVEVRIGGGFSDAQRQELWRDWQQDVAEGIDYGRVMGRLIEIEYHEELESGSLRHPRFLKFRDDKDYRSREAA